MWQEAVKNTVTKKYHNDNLGLVSYIGTCKKCNTLVKNSPTREIQVIGNCQQTVTICNECNKPFVITCYKTYNFHLKSII